MLKGTEACGGSIFATVHRPLMQLSALKVFFSFFRRRVGGGGNGMLFRLQCAIQERCKESVTILAALFPMLEFMCTTIPLPIRAVHKLRHKTEERGVIDYLRYILQSN